MEDKKIESINFKEENIEDLIKEGIEEIKKNGIKNF